MHDLIAALKPYESYIRIREHEPMAHHTTFRIGGPADLFLECASGAPLGEIIPLVRGAGVPLYVIGRGSNLLVRDEGVRGAVLCTAEMHEITITGSSTIVAEAGASLFSIDSTALRQGLAGAEFAAGIPGTLGGAVFMNAGAYGGQMADLIVRTHYLDSDGKPGVIEGDAHGFGYRESIFKAHPDWTILRAELRLTPGSPAGIREKMQDYAQRRREKQPLEFPSAGSTFKRPEGYFAGKLIQDSGLMGYAVGGAQVSEKHAGFLINRGGATCADMLALIEYVQKTVLQNFGVELQCEVRLI